jgi:hypothetical protein
MLWFLQRRGAALLEGAEFLLILCKTHKMDTSSLIQNTDTACRDFQTPDPQCRFKWKLVGSCGKIIIFSAMVAIVHTLCIYDFEENVYSQ